VAGQHRGTTATAAPGPGGGQPSGGAFADQVAFELGEGGDHVEDELGARGGGVDHLLETAEPDPALGEFGNGVDQVPQGVTEAVELPNDEGVAGAELVQDLGEGGRSVRAPLAVSTNTRGLSDAEACLAGLLLPTAPA
jgi:hypothetical protein